MIFEQVEALTVGELIARDGGSIKTGPFGTVLKASEYSSVGVPLISVREIGHGSFHIDAKTPRVSPATVARLPEYLLMEGDIVFARKGGIERCALVTKKEAGWFLGSDGIRVRAKKSCDSRFLAAALQTRSVKEWLIQNSTGSTMASLNQATISRLPIAIPSIGQQEAIAEILGALSDRIALLRETNATLEAIAQALFKSWFVDFEPVRAKLEGRAPEGIDEATATLFPDDFEESNLGLVPRGWRRSTLGAICAAHGGAIQTGPFGSQLHASDYLAEGFPVVMPQDIQTRRVQVEKIARISGTEANRLSRHQLRPGDIVFSRRGDVGRHALAGEREAGWLCGTGCLLVRPGAAWPSPTYLSLALDRTEAKDWLLRHAVGATMPNLNTGILSDVPIMWPETSVLAAFDNYVRVLDERVSHGHACIRSLTKIRDSLLPRLIAGQLQLPDAEQFTAALKAA
jgi:type I restriction enzyme S subunit